MWSSADGGLMSSLAVGRPSPVFFWAQGRVNNELRNVATLLIR